MANKKQDKGSFGLVVFGYAVLIVWLAYLLLGPGRVPAAKPCECQPVPTPATCCKSEECRKELALVDARFGDVWDELVEVQEQLAKVKPCDCGQVKECCCKPSKSCECKPPEVKAQLPRHFIFKRCK